MDTGPEQEAPSSRTSRRWPLIGAILLAAAGIIAWFVTTEPRGSVTPATADAGAAMIQDAAPVLSLDEGDGLLKKLAAKWSSDALFAKWLDALVVRQLAAATQAVAEGSSPRALVPFISIASPFAVREDEQPRRTKKQARAAAPVARAFIAPESYARYDAAARAFGSIDAAAAGDAWAKVEPFCDVAFAEIARPGTRFHDALATAVRRMLRVAVPAGDIEVEAKGAIYIFKDPELEARTAAEKHLVRMGAENARLIQRQLATFAEHAKLDVSP